MTRPELGRDQAASALRAWGLALGRMYAGIVFSPSTRVGALVLLATMMQPRAGLHGLLSVAVAATTARQAGLIKSADQLSRYSYSALYLGLGASQTFAGAVPALLLATLGAAAAVMLTAGIGHWTNRGGLPALSLPFLVIYWGAIAVGRLLGADWAVGSYAATFGLSWPWPVVLFLRALSALVWGNGPLTGLIVLAALILHSRVAVQLAALAFCIALAVDRSLSLSAPHLLLGSLVNGIMTAIGLGSGWYLPSFTSYLRAAFGVVLCTFLTLSLAEPLARLGIPSLSLPFNLSIFVVLLAARQSQSRSASALTQAAAASIMQLPAEVHASAASPEHALPIASLVPETSPPFRKEHP